MTFDRQPRPAVFEGWARRARDETSCSQSRGDLLVSVAYVALASARYVLPMLDALEARVPEGRLPG